ncbi:CaiB/BaiF CoA transferase family protein [Bradyrhizobium sp. 1.29L]
MKAIEMTASKVSTGPLKGVRILDLTTVVFGSLATQILGDWGADVVKVETLSGDVFRYHGVARNRGMSGLFMSINRNKRSVAVDLKSEAGKSIVHRLMRSADVFVSNIRPAALKRLKLGYDECRAENPRLIYAAATGYGQDGPWASRPAYDEIIQAASGLASSIGTDDRPQFVPSLIGDKLCGLVLASAISAALYGREKSGEGQYVEVPMLETIAAFNSFEMLGGHSFVPPEGVPGYPRLKARRPIQTKDGWISLLPYSGESWRRFLEAVGRSECFEKYSVSDPVARDKNVEQLYEVMQEEIIKRTTAEWEKLLLEIDIPHAAFAKMSEISEQEHLKAVNAFPEADHPSEGRIRYAKPMVRFSADPAGVTRLAPRLGEHTREVLTDAGISRAEIDGLIARKVLGAE